MAGTGTESTISGDLDGDHMYLIFQKSWTHILPVQSVVAQVNLFVVIRSALDLEGFATPMDKRPWSTYAIDAYINCKLLRVPRTALKNVSNY